MISDRIPLGLVKVELRLTSLAGAWQVMHVVLVAHLLQPPMHSAANNGDEAAALRSDSVAAERQCLDSP